MLAELVIRDVAVFEEAELAFGPGLNAVTGETGAGKSLVVGALELLVGGARRGGAGGIVRSGAKRARVDARFLVGEGEETERVEAWLAEHAPDLLEEWREEGPGERELSLSRVIGADGRTRAYLGGRPATLRRLAELASLLLQIHGQNDHQALFEPREQLRLLDLFGGLAGTRATYGERRARWRELAARAAELAARESERRRRLELLRHQQSELDAAGLAPGESAALREERELLRSSEGLRAELGAAVEAIGASDDALVDGVRRVEQIVARAAERFARLAPSARELAEARVHLEEVERALGSFVGAIESDPARLEAVEERLAEIEGLERRHGARGDELEEVAAGIAREVAALEGEDRERGESERALGQARAAMAEAAGELARARRAAAPEVARAVRGALGELGLAGATLEVRVAEREGDDEARFGPDGADAVEILFGANAGEAARPLRHVASGGEAARVMLALRGALSGAEAAETIVFDEVDAGVGGRLGPRVGEHLARLARRHQVLCVTHLPGVAAAASTHLRVVKTVARGRTRAGVEELEGEAREREIAAMIAGAPDQATARAEARRLLQRDERPRRRAPRAGSRSS